MRKLIYAINVTIDGCFDHTNGVIDDELYEFYSHLVKYADLIVYGRKTYQLMVPYWIDIAKNPTDETKGELEYARAFEPRKKIVFSRTMTDAEETNTKIIPTNLEGETRKLKQAQGGYILTGGVDVPSQLIALDLVDEYYFVVHPIIAGDGRRLLNDSILKQKLQLKLIESKVLKSGVVVLHYSK